MPKTRVRKRGHAPQQNSPHRTHQDMGTTPVKTTVRGKKTANPRAKAAENLVMPTLVALGCWGLAFSFIFLTSDANHYLYGGMAVIMALMWTGMVALRVARIRQASQNVHQ